MAVHQVVAALKRGVTQNIYKAAHVAGGRFGQVPESIPNEPAAFRFSRILPQPLPRKIDGLWRHGVLRSLVVASDLQHLEDLAGVQGNPSLLSTSTRYQPIPQISRADFLSRFKASSETDKRAIRLAYDIGLAAHSKQARDVGGAYFSHPKAVALILTDDCGIKEARLIIAALLHDVLEDTTLLGRDLGEARVILTDLFGIQTAETVIALTKQTVLEKALLASSQKTDRIARLNRYIRQLVASPAGTVLVKIADRLHNAQSISQFKVERQQRFVKETREVFLPLFNQAEIYYADHPEYLGAARFLLARLARTLEQIEGGS